MTKTNLTLGLLAGALVVSSLACGDNKSVNTANKTSTNTTSNTAVVTSTPGNTSVSNGNTANSNSLAVVQDNFWTTAAQGGMAEVALAKLALEKSQNAEVKKFAQMMVTDHGKVNEELKSVAAKKNVVLPTDMGSYQSALDDLGKLSGAEFDKKYVEMMVDNHEEDVEFFGDKSGSSDAEIKAFTTKHLPTLKKHLETIKAIQSKMK